MGIKKILKENLPSVMLEPLRRMYGDMHYAAMHVVPEEWYLKRQFKKRVGYSLNLDNPRTFNEKLQWLKLYDRNPLYTKMVDKYEAKKYVSDIIGEEYIIPTLGVWEHFDDIDFDKLPNQFVLKCTHDSGSIVICKDRVAFDKKSARKKLERGLRYNYYYAGGFEWPYKNVKPRIIAEKYMVDELQTELKEHKVVNFNGEPNIIHVEIRPPKQNQELTDYKLMCFNGKVECVFTCTGRGSRRGLHVTFYDKQWKKLSFARHYPIEQKALPKPKNYEKMVQLAEILAAPLKFARIDFYEINGRIYFGEITFFPGNGMEEFSPEKWDYRIGEWLEL